MTLARSHLRLIIELFVLIASSAVSAQSPAPVSGGPVPVPLPATTPLGSGPYPALMESDPTLATHTIYRPADLDSVKASELPIVVWGNGACANSGNRFRWFLSEISSYGFLVIAVGPIGDSNLEVWPIASMTSRAPADRGVGAARGPLPPAATHTVQLIQAIDWAVAENERPASRFYHRLDPRKIAVMGQSCGGVQAIEASKDPRVSTTVVWNSGLLSEPTDMAGGKSMTKADLSALRGPVAYISGDSEDIAFTNANDDFERLTSIVVFRAYEKGVPHTGTYRQPGGGEFGGVAVAWLRWQLNRDERAGRMFTGPECGLCVNPRWVVRRKKIN